MLVFNVVLHALFAWNCHCYFFRHLNGYNAVNKPALSSHSATPFIIRESALNENNHIHKLGSFDKRDSLSDALSINPTIVDTVVDRYSGIPNHLSVPQSSLLEWTSAPKRLDLYL